MPDPVHVPGIPGPYRQLCWQQDPVRLLRCDRARNHNGLHTWEWAAITTALAEAEAFLNYHKMSTMAAAVTALMDELEATRDLQRDLACLRVSAQVTETLLMEEKNKAEADLANLIRELHRTVTALGGSNDLPTAMKQFKEGEYLADLAERRMVELTALKADDDTAIVSRARDICHRHGYVVDADTEGWTTCAVRHLEAELVAARADIANWPVCEQHKPGMWDGDPPCVICEAHTAIADLAALKGRACDCCTFRWPGNTRDRDVCGKVSIPGHSVAVVLCDQLHRTCGAWAAKETP